MFICNIMGYVVCVRTLNKLTIMEIKFHHELGREILLQSNNSFHTLYSF
jgi:hypothetical protein